MTAARMLTWRWSNGAVILSLLLLFFTIPHTLEDFAYGEPTKAGIPSSVIAYVVAGMFALQAFALFSIGRRMRRGYMLHAIIGLFWPLAAGATQLPAIFSQSSYRAGLLSVFFVGGILVIGVLLLAVSILALKENQ